MNPSCSARVPHPAAVDSEPGLCLAVTETRRNTNVPGHGPPHSTSAGGESPSSRSRSREQNPLVITKSFDFRTTTPRAIASEWYSRKWRSPQPLLINNWFDNDCTRCDDSAASCPDVTETRPLLGGPRRTAETAVRRGVLQTESAPIAGHSTDSSKHLRDGVKSPPERKHILYIEVRTDTSKPTTVSD